MVIVTNTPMAPMTHLNLFAGRMSALLSRKHGPPFGPAAYQRPIRGTCAVASERREGAGTRCIGFASPMPLAPSVQLTPDS
jgi:hypothetical protein